MRDMTRSDLSESRDGEWNLQEEMRQSNERIDAMVQEAREADRRYHANMKALNESLKVALEESRAVTKAVWELVDRLPPPPSRPG